MDLLLQQITWQTGQGLTTADVRISKGLIAEVGALTPGRKEVVHHLAGHFIYPGLINAHDHLEMNVYPRMGKPPYENYVQWSHDVRRPLESPVKEIERIAIGDRLLWGGLKNLISGVTAVAHHNPSHRLFDSNDFPVRVIKPTAWAHSLAFGKDITANFFRNRNIPFVIHAAEGIDAVAGLEIDTLSGLDLLHSNTVIIHGVAVSLPQLDLLTRQQCAVVWCPASNDFMFGKTAPVREMKKKVRVALGTDSTMTGSPTLLHEMHEALRTNLASKSEIFEMVTNLPAVMFHRPIPRIDPGQPADLFIVPRINEDYINNLFVIHPPDIVMVLVNGQVQLQDDALDTISMRTMRHVFSLQGKRKRTNLNIGALKQRIARTVRVKDLEENPLWTLMET